MKKICVLLVVCLLGVAAQAGPVGLIDDFSGDLSAYTSTVILDTDPGGGANTATWQITGETLELNTSVYQSIEQYAMIYGGLSLAVGEEVQIDITHSGASQDIGLYVGGTTPTYNVRQDYIAMYSRGDGDVFTRGFDGTSEYGLIGDWGNPAHDKLFIARTAVNTFEAGYYDGATRTVLGTRTPTYANEADVVGFYADVRGAGVLGNLDNLTIIPEPATIALLGLGGLALLRRKR